MRVCMYAYMLCTCVSAVYKQLSTCIYKCDLLKFNCQLTHHNLFIRNQRLRISYKINIIIKKYTLQLSSWRQRITCYMSTWKRLMLTYQLLNYRQDTWRRNWREGIVIMKNLQGEYFNIVSIIHIIFSIVIVLRFNSNNGSQEFILCK